MLKNTKVKVKALVCFGGIILVSVISMAVLLMNMNSIAQSTQMLYRQPYTANNSMWAIRRSLVDIERVLNKLMNVKGDKISAAATTAQKTLDEDSESISQAISLLNTLFTTEDKKEILSQIQSGIQKASPIREEIVQLCLGGKSSDAAVKLKNEYEPLFDEVNDQVVSLFDIVSKDADAFVANASQTNNRSILIGSLLIAVSILMAIGITTWFTKSIVAPITQLTKAANEMSKGNLKVVSHVTYKAKDEMGQLADSLRTTMTNLAAYVDEISAVLTQISAGDLTVSQDTITDYLGDFSSIKTSLVLILKRFNTTLGEIRISAEQVDVSSSQVSSAAQGLSDGSNEQAASLKELTATVEQISEQIRENSNNAENANRITNEAGEQIEMSNQQMQQMITAMRDISDRSNEIGKIIKTIEDIAFQTNILALNAAVEAARAGEAGKGFAVVADEVRNLASKSAEASKNTASMIEASISAVDRGTQIADETAQSLYIVVEKAKEVVTTVEKIADASERQADSIEQVSQSVEQISKVVQNNSATAEESAAASEELSGQAASLNQLVERFHLYRIDEDTTPFSSSQVLFNEDEPFVAEQGKY